MTEEERFSIFGSRYKLVVKYLKALLRGFDEETQEYGNGGVDKINNQLTTTNTKLEDVKNLLNNLRVDVKADDIDIGEINLDTTEIIEKLNAIITANSLKNADIAAIKTVLDANIGEVQKLQQIKEVLNNIKTTEDDIKTNSDTVKDDVATIKSNTTTTNTKLDSIKIVEDNLYTLLSERLLKRQVLTRALYDALATKDANTLYYIIESQSN